MVAATHLIPFLALLGSASAGVCRSKSSSSSAVLAVQTKASNASSTEPSTPNSDVQTSIQSSTTPALVLTESGISSSSVEISSASQIGPTSSFTGSASSSIAPTSSSAAVVILAVNATTGSSSTSTSTAPTSSVLDVTASVIESTTSTSTPPPSSSSSASPTSGSASVVSSTTSTASVTSSKSKVGVSWPVQEKDAAPIAQFFTDDSVVSWWYDWNKNWNQGIFNSDGVTISGEFIPMLYNQDFLDNSDSFQDGFTEIMGYNEPDLNTGTVSDALDPAAAAAVWKTQITQIRQQYPDVKVHSPAMASNQSWLEDFFAAICPDDNAANAWGDCAYKPDYVSMHIYTVDADYFKGTVAGYQKAFGIPLVLSEWACYDFTSKPTPAADVVSTFMAETMTWMDQQDWLVKYSWYGAARSSDYLYGVAETNRLLDQDGQLTDLGKQYMAGGTA